MRTTLALPLALWVSTSLALCTLPTDPEEYRQWERESLASVEAQKRVVPAESIPKLGKWAAKLALGSSNVEKGERPVFHAVQSALLAIPGHAKYYQDQIEQTRTFQKHYESLSQDEQHRMQQEYRERNEDLGSRHDYDGARRNAFVILGLLPSPETVAVLGHFLEDPEGRDGKDVRGNPIFYGSDVGPPLPNCGQAYTALEKLGIEHPPIPPAALENMEVNLERADAWKQWWSEIKSGKRTYRFKGSPIDYGPEGPATKEQLERITKNQRRDDRADRGHGSPPADSKDAGPQEQRISSPTYLLIAAVTALLGSATWYLRKTRSDMS